MTNCDAFEQEEVVDLSVFGNHAIRLGGLHFIPSLTSPPNLKNPVGIAAILRAAECIYLLPPRRYLRWRNTYDWDHHRRKKSGMQSSGWDTLLR